MRAQARQQLEPRLAQPDYDQSGPGTELEHTNLARRLFAQQSAAASFGQGRQAHISGGARKLREAVAADRTTQGAGIDSHAQSFDERLGIVAPLTAQRCHAACQTDISLGIVAECQQLADTLGTAGQSFRPELLIEWRAHAQCVWRARLFRQESHRREWRHGFGNAMPRFVVDIDETQIAGARHQTAMNETPQYAQQYAAYKKYDSQQRDEDSECAQ